MKGVIALLFLATPAMAQTLQPQTVPPGSNLASVLAEAQNDCQAADTSAPASLDIQPPAITWTDLDGDEERDDAVVDFNYVYCSSGPLWQGTGGAPIHALLNVAEIGPRAVWTGWDWQVVGHGGRPVLLISQHGTACGATGSDPCVLAISFSDGQVLVGNNPAE